MSKLVFTYTRINGVETQQWVDAEGKVHRAVVGRIQPTSNKAIPVEETPVIEREEVVELDTSHFEWVNANSRRVRAEEQARVRALYEEAYRKEYAKKHQIKSLIKDLLK